MAGDSDSGPHSAEAGSDRLTARVSALEQTVAELERQIAKMSASQVATVDASVSVPPAIPVAARPAPSSPHKPSDIWTTKASGFDLEKLIAGHWLNRIGIVAVAVGVSYFLKYAIDNDWIGPRGQVALGILLGAGLLSSMPWFLKQGHVYFADSMAALGAAVLYLALWAGGSYYHLFPLGFSFAAMAGVTTAMIAIAVMRSSQRVALLALLGGFASPALVRTGQDSQITLFTYLAVLNSALLPLAWLRDWRSIELPAFFLTQIYFWGWYITFYTAGKLTQTSLFTALFFSMFLAVPAVRGRRPGRVSLGDALLVPLNAGACLAAFSAMLWPQSRWTLTLAALALSIVHALVARAVPVREGKAEARLLLGGVALTLATLVIPIRFDGSWVTLAWSVEGAVLMWTGFRVRSSPVRVLAFVLFVIAAMRILESPASIGPPNARFLLNTRFLAAMVTVACFATALWTARDHRRHLSKSEETAFGILAVMANVLAIWALTAEVRTYFQVSPLGGRSADFLAEGLSVSLLWTLYAGGLMFFGMRQKAPGLRWQALALFGLTIFKVFVNDMSLLSGFYRIASSIALGIVLLIVSFVYQRSLKVSAGESS